MSNISRILRRNALGTPDRVAISYGGRPISYALLWDAVQRIGGRLEQQGVRPGDRVALLMKNSAAFIAVSLAISHVGAVIVPINFRLAPDEVDFILKDSGAVLLFCDEELALWMPSVGQVITVSEAMQSDVIGLSAGSGAAAMAPAHPDDLMRILYTSGTTDRPKGVMHLYGNFYMKCADHIVELGLSGDTRLLVSGPLYHVGAYDLPGVAVLWAGGMLCIQRDFDAGDALDLIARERLTGSWFAPVMTGAILAAQTQAPRDVSSLLWTIGGGERTPESRVAAYAAAFPNARYLDAYGLTETCGGDTFLDCSLWPDRVGSVGRPVSQADVTIRDEAGECLPAGREGEICIRGGKVTPGYWNAPEKTAASFFGDWFRTGDAGYLDADGFLYVTDRIKDMIISGGENIASSEIERAILELPGIQDVAVIGKPDPQWGERPVAFVVPQAGLSVDGDAVRAHCRSRLAGFKVPDAVFLRSALPRSASGKILKRELRMDRE